MVERVGPRVLLVFGTHEVPDAALVVVGAVVQQELDHGWVLVHDGDVQDVLACGGRGRGERGRAVTEGRFGEDRLGIKEGEERGDNGERERKIKDSERGR